MSTYGHPPIPDPCPEAHHAQRAHDDFHALLAWASECPDPEDVAEKAIRSMCAILKAPAVEATFRVFERDAKGERVDSGVRIKGHMTAPVIEVVRTPATPAPNPDTHTTPGG